MSNTSSVLQKIAFLCEYRFNDLVHAEEQFPQFVSLRGTRRTTSVVNKIRQHYIKMIAHGAYTKSHLDQDIQRLLNFMTSSYLQDYKQPLLNSRQKKKKEMLRSFKAFLYLAYIDSEENIELMCAMLQRNLSDIGMRAFEAKSCKIRIPHPANPKTDLNNMCQKRWRRKFKLNPVFTTIPQGVVCHLTLKLKNAHNRQSTGAGQTEQDAENNAAQNMLTQLNEAEEAV